MMEENEKLLEKLRKLVDDEPDELTDREVARLRQMIEAYDTLLASGRLGKWVMGTVILLAGAITGFVKLAEYLVATGSRPQ
ncbi:hypothetical protein Pan4_19 [Pseudanabaena phage Pan4]|nr:hypothetical protein Pan4_19 [Pseudanabaena phage Pan4]